MSVLLDASALLNIVRSLGPDALNYIKGCYELAITPYEIGNAIWKEATLLGRLTIDEALTLLNLISLIHRHLNIVNPRNTVAVLKLAYELRITYYDASYVVAANELGLPLVTDDTKLRKRLESSMDVVAEMLGKKVEVLSSSEYTAKRK